LSVFIFSSCAVLLILSFLKYVPTCGTNLFSYSHESELLEGALGLIATTRPVIVTEGVVGFRNENDKKVQQILNTLGYTKSNDIPELCGFNLAGRNRIWWPDDETETAAMAIVKKELTRPGLTPWFNIELP